MVPAGSRRVSRARRYSGAEIDREDVFAYGTVTLCGATFQTLPLTRSFVTVAPIWRSMTDDPTTPETQRLQAYTQQVWAVPISLATTLGIEVSFFSSGY